ncbi:YCII-related domain protein [Aureobasidium namibiae CBS 147.97]|uniref:YCII-related domain protein n=1 Tax=Aureobasidium namibiae CBS 147.97 TaxID=1043004 RepID=A0A074WTZ1_9PEZI|nr:YCII-related domain protein [Aureobasidium namibiae CBS 147.97]KEQ75034.1 YCII-related domain protein [Aureobasidium namibiae CBS 147.97]
MSQKYEWMVILPDNVGALDKRMAVREQHLAAVKPNAESGFWVLGGAMLEDTPKEGSPLKITGSVMMAVASSKEEVMEKIKSDIYADKGVWDMDKIQIFPFKSAIRSAL